VRLIISSILLKRVDRLEDPDDPEPWWPIKEEHQEANGDLDAVISNC